MIPYGRQSISEEDIQAVIDVLRSDFLTQGPVVQQFEEAVASYCGAHYAVAVNSATSALHIACLAAGLGSEDTLWTSPNTFVASANCALYCNAAVDFVDIDPRTYNLSITELMKKLENAAQKERLPKVLIPVHFAGQPCEMAEIRELSNKYGIFIIEDASHAIGARYRDEFVGCCSFSDMTVFSFHPVKIITTGEGGMVLTNSRDMYDKLIRLRSHGITRDLQLMDGESHGLWYYQQIELGFNYRITDFQAALGVSQMVKLDEFVARRRYLADRYDKALGDLPLTLPWQHPDSFSAFHLYVIRLQVERLGQIRRTVFERMRDKGISANVHYIPVHTQPYYRSLGFQEGDFPEAERYYREAITLPLFPAMTDSEQDQISETLREIIASPNRPDGCCHG
jgi:UDP-4-amino-4,6-dideoxy-N-acetyl-beta-L-altrosamine transaminase